MADTQQHALFILVADERSGKLLRRLANGELEEEWTLYSADDRVRSDFANRTFVVELAERLSETCEQYDVKSIVVIAPQHFADLMKAGFDAALWERVQHTVPRDRADLSDASLRKLVDATLEIYG